jgi:IS1 family transposase
VSNILKPEKRLKVLAALVDGNSERACERMTGVNRETVGRFALRLGTAAQSLHNMQAHDLSISLIEQDEIWSYVYKKQARVTPEEHAAGLGEAYSFVALGMPSRYVVTWKVGKRDQETADAFEVDLRARLVVMPAMTSDGFAAYPSAIGAAFGPGVDYGQTIKNYTKSGRKDDDHRYEPPRVPFVTKKAIFGAPDMDRATTAHVERNNGTIRHFIGRMRRLVYAFSKDPAHHAAAVSLGYVHYNLCHVLRTTRVTPAMAAGVVRGPWELEELLDALMSVPETGTPEKKPLAPRKPEGPARELPNGRGFLRIVPSGGAPAAPPPAPPAVPAPAAPLPAVASSSGAPAATQAPTSASAAPSASTSSTAVDALPGQLDLLSYRPAPRPKAGDVPAAPAPRPTPTRIDATPEQLGLLFGIEPESPKK